ncbi:flagellin [Mesorhizobium sp. L-8-10]|uniref:flagellar hook-associated family protein n=1 Tax=Mesorhizobium sp. L-8-10 TaxID=2744523 RepID=UPI001928A5F7|nr:flagellar hook-associated family protein [Mesorhizobium sp. L-8-10]BCH30947.1 flagellin [Mesorhizobium sp. L-8-10]
MKISFVSTQAVSKALSYQLARLQTDLVKAQQEVSTGKYADVGLALGARTGQAVALSRDADRLKGLVDSNALVSARLDATEEALTHLTSEAETFLSALTVGGSGDTEQKVLQVTAQNMLETLTSVLNTSQNGEYIFAGVNTDIQPIKDYKAGSANKAAFDQAFFDTFGFDQTNPSAETITAAQMTDFLTNVVEPMFFGPDWSSNWSNATDDAITSRIALNETAQTSVSANTAGARKLAMASSLVADLFQGPLNENAREALVGQARTWVGEAISDINNAQAQLGLIQNRVDSASERMKMQIDIFKINLNDLQGVDPYEASTRVNTLLAQIETSYALTARIQKLSLLNYL